MKIIIALMMLFSSVSRASEYSIDIEGPKKGIYTITVWKDDEPLVFKVDQKSYDNNKDAMISEIVRKTKDAQKF